MTMQRDDLASSPFWAITAYFNPAGYEARRTNFRIFRDHLKLPLVAVELAFDSDFELADGDAEILIRLSGGDVLWQKERLLNVALQALPPHCRKVAWLDCDIVFVSDDWAEGASSALDATALIQPYTHAYPMPRGWRPGLKVETAPEEWSAVASQIAGGLSLSEALEPPINVHRTSRGYAWAARREILDAHGFYDACIVGGGDTAMARAAFRLPEGTVRVHQWDPPQADHYRAWALPFGDSVGGTARAVEGTVHHLWHGGFANRSYRSRYAALKPFAFDPNNDIALTGDGVWRWASDKPDLHRHLRRYFVDRREDD